MRKLLHRSDLEPYQVEAIEYIKQRKKCGAFLRMGFGKTAITLTALSDMLDDFVISKVLVVAPKRVANLVWKQEAQHWSHLQHLKMAICTEDRETKLEGFRTKADIHITNREFLPDLIYNFRFKWDAVVLDESTGFKSHKSKRFKYAKHILPNLDSMIELSGTPAPNGLEDLWSQLYLIDQGERLGRNITKYRKDYFERDYLGHKYIPQKGSFDKIMAKVSDVCFTSDHVIEGLEVRHVQHKVQLPRELKDQYETFEEDFVLELANGVDLEAESAAGRTNKLLQFCGGQVYDSERNVHKIHEIKLDALKQIVEDNPGENFVIAYAFKPDRDLIIDAIEGAEYLGDDPEQQERWDRGKIRALVTHPASAAYGLNLQYGGSILIWYGPTWSLELYEQLNERLPRKGQQHLVRIIHIIMEGTVEEYLQVVMRIKGLNQQEVMDYLKNAYVLRKEKIVN